MRWWVVSWPKCHYRSLNLYIRTCENLDCVFSETRIFLLARFSIIRIIYWHFNFFFCVQTVVCVFSSICVSLLWTSYLDSCASFHNFLKKYAISHQIINALVLISSLLFKMNPLLFSLLFLFGSLSKFFIVIHLWMSESNSDTEFDPEKSFRDTVITVPSEA